MTFSIAGRCSRTGAFGVAITTSSIAVGARCPHVRAGIGAVATQNITDPRLGPLVLDYMEDGLNAREAITAVTRNRPNIEFRQLTAVDQFGNSASFSGRHILGTHAISERRDCVAAGNLLKSGSLPDAMTESFKMNANEHLVERLLLALEAGYESGGEEGPVHSAALRVDWDDANPIARLRSLWNAYHPQMDAYLQRAVNPSDSPAYGVPGDP
jgi:uncharacterized Ntn-hydrolase superfamily protein